METFEKIVGKLNEDYEHILSVDTGDGYSKLSTIFEELGTYFQEYMQGATEKEIKVVIKKLKGDSTLTDEEMDLVRLWIVGDAQTYAELENNYQDWKDELKRLMSEITACGKSEVSIENAVKLRGLFRDGSRVLADMFYYCQQKDRVAKFQEASKNLMPEDRKLLASLLEQKILSKEY